MHPTVANTRKGAQCELHDEYLLNGNWLDGPLLPHKPLTKGPFFPPDRLFRTVFTRTVLTGTLLQLSRISSTFKLGKAKQSNKQCSIKASS